MFVQKCNVRLVRRMVRFYFSRDELLSGRGGALSLDKVRVSRKWGRDTEKVWSQWTGNPEGSEEFCMAGLTRCGQRMKCYT
jgi:hypothetical protein